MGDAALSGGDGSVSDFYVAGDADLSGENDVVAYIGRSGQADLPAEESVLAHAATMADLDEVVDFRAASNASFAYAGSVDAGVGLDLGVALYYYVAGLNDFMPAGGIVFREAEAVAAYYGSILEKDVVSQVAEFPDYRMGVGEEIVAYGCSAIDDHVGEEDSVGSDDDVFVDHYVGAYVCVLT